MSTLSSPSRWPALLLLLAGLAATAIVTRHEQRDATASARMGFEFAGHEIAIKVNDRLQNHEQILRSGAALFAASEKVTRADWRTFVVHLQLDTQLPGIQGLGYAQFIPPERLEQHLQEIRQEGFPDYHMWPEGERAVYTAIIYLEPFTDRNLRAFGYDMLSEPTRRAAMERARDDNAAALTGKVKLAQETVTDVQTGTLMYVPVYRRGMPVTTAAERRAALQGWVYSPYRMNDLMKGILGKWESLKGQHLRLQTFDGAEPAADALLYDSQAASEARLSSATRFTLQTPITCAGRRWTLRLTQSRIPASASDYNRVWVAAAAGTALSLLLAGLVHSLRNTRYRAQRIAGQLTANLQRTTERLALATEAGGVGIWDYEVNTNTLVWDGQMFRLYGITRDQFSGAYAAWQAGVHPEDRQRGDAEMQMALRGEKEFDTEFRVLWPDGTVRHIRALAHVQRNPADQPVRMLGTNWDITELKEAEALLQASEARLARAMNQAQLAHWEMDAATQTFTFNDRFYALYGTTAEREGGCRMSAEVYAREFLPPEVQHLVHDVVARLLSGETEELQLEHPIRRRSGELRHIVVRVTVVRDASGRVVGTRGANQDITERKRAEDEVRRQTALISSLLDSIPDVVFFKDTEGVYLGCNPAFVELLGRGRGEIIGKTDVELFGKEIGDFFREQDRRMLAKREPRHNEEWVTYPDGRRALLDTLKTPYLGPDGELIGVLGISRDITERKRAEALRQSEARLKRAQQVAGLGNWEWDLITKQLDWAEETYRLHGIDPQKVKPSYQELFQAIVPAEQAFVKKTVAAALAGKSSCEFDYTVIRPDNGQRCVIHSKVEVIVDDAGQAVKMVGTVQDITERKRLEARAQQARKMEAIGRLTGGVAHEFNNILAAIMTGLELTKLSGSWGEDRELLGVMEGSCHRAAGLVKQLLASSSQSVMRPQSLDLAATVANELEGLQLVLGKGITLEFNRPPSVSRVWADKALVKEMVRALCRNAQEAMPSGGMLRVELGEEEVGAERGKIHLDARAGRFVRLVVGDTGRGMDDQTLKRLFEPFFTTKDVVHGSGLSLAAALGVVRQHGGWVEVESRVGQGSTFRVYLPVEVRKGDTTVLARPVTPALGSRGLILLAEDDESLRQLTQKFLVRLGYQVLEAADGAEALAVWAAHEAEIDLIFTDMVMPGELSGLDVVQQAMAKKPGVKAIITSGYNTEKADLEAARTSGILYLPKPWVSKELEEIMGVMLGSGVAPTSQSNAVRI